MKRNFEEEYKNYVNNDMPDLWARIEPALKEKNGRKDSFVAAEDIVENSGAETVRKTNEEAENREWTIALRTRRRKNNWMKYASVAAGVVLCAAGISIYQNLGNENKSELAEEYTENTAMSDDCAAADICTDKSVSEDYMEESAVSGDDAMESVAEDSGEAVDAEENMTESAAEDRMEMAAEEEGDRTEPADAGKDATETGKTEEMELYAISEEGQPEALGLDNLKKEKVEHAVLSSSKKAPEKWEKKGYVSKYIFEASGRNYVVYVTEAQESWLEQKLYDPSYVGEYTLYLSIQKEGEKRSVGIFREKEIG